MTLVTAHSGCDGTPDNSIEYIRHALTLSVDALEADIWEKDGSLLLSHDRPDTMDHPSLREVMKEVREHAQMKLNCDLKEKGLEEKVYALAVEMGISDRLQFSGEVRTDLAGILPQMREKVLMNAENLIPDIYEKNRMFSREDAQELAKQCRKYGFSVLNVNYRFAAEEFDRIAAENEVGVSYWTVSTPEDIGMIIRRNPYNITSRTPETVLSLLRRCCKEDREC